MNKDAQDKSTASPDTKAAMRDLANGITATEGTENPTLNGDERNVGKDPFDEDTHPHSERHERNGFSFESDRSPWTGIAQHFAK